MTSARKYATGAAVLAGVLLVAAHFSAGKHRAPTLAADSPDVAKALAAKLAPGLVQKVQDHKAQILAAASPAPVRLGLRMGWDGLLREIPPLTEAAVESTLDEFGGMSLTDVARILAAYNTTKGRASHPSLNVLPLQPQAMMAAAPPVPALRPMIRFKDREPVRPEAQAQGQTALTPIQVAGLYQFPPGDGYGTTIGLIELGGGYLPSDLDQYFRGLGLATPLVIPVPLMGTNLSPDGTDADYEVTVDIQVAGAIAPRCAIKVYRAPNSYNGFRQAVKYAIHDHCDVLSISWAGFEMSWGAANIAAMETILQSAANLGVTICVASGDQGSNGSPIPNWPGVYYPASSKWVLACGGTTLTSNSEVVWPGSGGGVSDQFHAVPAWQQPFGIPVSANFFRKRGRGVPDWSANADPQTGYMAIVHGQPSQIGGTSVAAPLLAGLVAIAKQTLGRSPGYLNANLYGAGYRAGAFRATRLGGNGAYAAGTGDWNACTGLGSPLGTKLINALR